MSFCMHNSHTDTRLLRVSTCSYLVIPGLLHIIISRHVTSMVTTWNGLLSCIICILFILNNDAAATVSLFSSLLQYRWTCCVLPVLFCLLFFFEEGINFAFVSDRTVPSYFETRHRCGLVGTRQLVRAAHCQWFAVTVTVAINVTATTVVVVVVIPIRKPSRCCCRSCSAARWCRCSS